jgi:hypothetical protein
VFPTIKKLLVTLALLLSVSAFSQRFRNGINEMGILVGGGNYFGDLAPEIVLKETHPALGLFYKYHHSRYYTSRYQFAYTKVSGNDKNFAANSYRSLSFESNIFELGYSGEFNFRGYGANSNQREESSTSYVFAGFNLFMFNPTAELPSGDKIELRDIGTEGQKLKGKTKKTYSTIQPNISFGLGYKFNVKKTTVIGIEFGFRKLFTDYLDDTKGAYPDYQMMVNKQGVGAAELSQPQTTQGKPVIPAGTMRGDNHLNDWYFITGITISFRNILRDPCPSM